MPKLKPETQEARRTAILDASELCFARSGFHRTTMQDICNEARISPGAFYVYFASKEELIAGICKRDRQQFAARFQYLREADDILIALQHLANAYLIEDADHKKQLCIEIGSEANRNPRVREQLTSVDEYVEESFVTLITRLEAEGRIQPRHDARTLAGLIMVLADGLLWRSAICPSFDIKTVLSVVIATIGAELGLDTTDFQQSSPHPGDRTTQKAEP